MRLTPFRHSVPHTHPPHRSPQRNGRNVWNDIRHPHTPCRRKVPDLSHLTATSCVASSCQYLYLQQNGLGGINSDTEVESHTYSETKLLSELPSQYQLTRSSRQSPVTSTITTQLHTDLTTAYKSCNLQHVENQRRYRHLARIRILSSSSE